MERRDFLKTTTGVLLGTAVLGCAGKQSPEHEDAFDVTVVGGTPAGIMAAIAAARLGAKVALLEYHPHIGGMSTSGLGKSDVENRDAIGGLFHEFTQRVLEHYTNKYGASSDNVAKCRNGYYYEPSVAEHVFNSMITDENITVLVNHQLNSANVSDDRIETANFTDRSIGKDRIIQSKIFIDATYEGDLYAHAGAAYRLGRESRSDFNEPHAGQIFFDYNEKVILEGSTGEGDKKLPAYTYRLCLTDDPENSYVLSEPPPGYDRNNYVSYFNDLKEGRLSAPPTYKDGHGFYAAHFDTMLRVFSFTEIPNRKYDVNINPRPLGFPFAGESYSYAEAGWDERRKIFERHRNLTLGLLYFVQNDSEVPEAHRKLALQYHLPKDEFTDNEHFPWQLYIREARRLRGQYTFTENDVKKAGSETRSNVFSDAVVSGEFPIDSFPVSPIPSADRKVLEGYIGLLGISPYQMPYRIMIPEKIKGLIVPVAASTTHVAYSTVRMEPLWMALGQAAGVAAQVAIGTNADVSSIPVPRLQRMMLEQGQVLTYFNDIDKSDSAYNAVQFWGTKGFFDSYEARTQEPLDATDRDRWIGIVSRLLDNEQNDIMKELNGSLPENRGRACVALYDLFFKKLGVIAVLLFSCSFVFAQSIKSDPLSPIMLAGDWVPGDTHEIDFEKIPKLQGEHVVVSDVNKENGVNQHNYLTWYDGKYWIMWSDGPGIEDRVGQRVKFATSPDGLKWTTPEFLSPEPPQSGKDSPHYGTRSDKGFRYIARGFWQREGELLALASVDEAAGFFGPGLELRAFRWNRKKNTWDDAGVIYDNAINNFPPEKLPTGEWMMSRRTYNYKTEDTHFLVGGTKSIDQWESFPVKGSTENLAAEEPNWWLLPDNNLVALFRDNLKSGYIFRSFSSDNGRTWSRPVRTNFPDARSKFASTRLKDGRYVLVSNANYLKRDPLVVSVSDDGVVFNKMYYLVGGRHVDYPHVIEHNGYLLVAFAGAKKSVEVIKVPLQQLEK